MNSLQLDIIDEFIEASLIHRSGAVSRWLQTGFHLKPQKPKKVRQRKAGACVTCRRISCRCAKKASSKHRRDYKLKPRASAKMAEAGAVR
jgi:hypothetical protein